MEEYLKPGSLNRFFVLFCGLVTVSLGIAAFLIPKANFVYWLRPDSNYYPMAYSTALCILLLGIALITTLYRWIFVTRILVALVVIEACIAVTKHTFHLKIFEQCNIISFNSCFLLNSHLQTSIIAAVVLALFAIAFWENMTSSAGKHSTLCVGVIGISSMGLSILFLFGYVIHGNDPIPINPLFIFLGMAGNASLAIFILGAGAIALSVEFGRVAGLNFRKFVPVLSAFFVGLLSLSFWHYILLDRSLSYLPTRLAFLAMTREAFIAGVVGLAIYFAQTSYQLAKRAQRLAAMTRSILDGVAEGIFVINTKNQIVGSNRRLLEMWSIPPELHKETDFDAVNRYVASQVVDEESFYTTIGSTLLYNGELQRGEIALKNGKFFEYTTFPERMGDRIIGHVCSFHDITHLKRTESELLFQATHDVLTGLANRFLLSEHIQKSISLARRNNLMVALLFFDLDRFKQINDSLGHGIGDMLLKAVAGRLQEKTRAEDTLARVGGDEFVLLITNVADDKQIVVVVERFLEALNQPFLIESHKLYISCSIGISLYPRDGDKAESLLKNADIAMYEAKKKGIPYKHYEEKLELMIVNRLLLESELRRAVEENMLLLHYQPMIDIETGVISGTEALVRWRRYGEGIVMPIDFIAIAEESALINTIGEWVLRTACIQNQAWIQKGLLNAKISVNLSPVQLRASDFADKVESILRESALDPNLLELELTEGIFLDDFSQIKSIYERLKALGVDFSIDDFGTGYASLNYLKNLPLDTIKIDKSFVDDVPQAAQGRAIIVAILALAKSLRLRVVAEGVEREEQAVCLHALGCKEMQGYYFAPPMEAKDYENSLLTIHSKLARLRKPE